MIIHFLVIASAIGAITFTISVTSIFKWLRELLSKIHSKIDELIHCPFCLSFWITLILCFFLKRENIFQVTKIFIIDYLVFIFAVMGVSGIFHYILLRAYEPVAKSMMYRKLEKLKAKENELQH